MANFMHLNNIRVCSMVFHLAVYLEVAPGFGEHAHAKTLF